MKDESDRYTTAVAVEADIEWIFSGAYKRLLRFVLPRIEKHEIGSVIEWGCGTGLFAAGLPSSLRYCGYDASETLLELAKRRTDRPFSKENVRYQLPTKPVWFDLVTAWSLFKHISLEEWNTVVSQTISIAKHASFNVPILPTDLDNGKDYPHVYVTEERLAAVLTLAGHAEVEREVFSESEVQGHGRMKDVVLWTSRKNT